MSSARLAFSRVGHPPVQDGMLRRAIHARPALRDRVASAPQLFNILDSGRQCAPRATGADMHFEVGTRLRNLRQIHGLSQRELAKRAGVTNGMISLIEQGRVSPSVSSLTKVLDGLPMTLADFFTLDLAAPPQAFYPRAALAEGRSGPVAWR